MWTDDQVDAWLERRIVSFSAAYARTLGRIPEWVILAVGATLLCGIVTFAVVDEADGQTVVFSNEYEWPHGPMFALLQSSFTPGSTYFFSDAGTDAYGYTLGEEIVSPLSDALAPMFTGQATGMAGIGSVDTLSAEVYGGGSGGTNGASGIIGPDIVVATIGGPTISISTTTGTLMFQQFFRSSTQLPRWPNFLIESGSGYRYVQVPLGVQLQVWSNLRYRKNGAGQYAVVATGPGGDWVTVAEYQIRPLVRSGGGGGSDPYTAQLAAAFGAASYTSGQLGSSIISTAASTSAISSTLSDWYPDWTTHSSAVELSLGEIVGLLEAADPSDMAEDINQIKNTLSDWYPDWSTHTANLMDSMYNLEVLVDSLYYAFYAVWLEAQLIRENVSILVGYLTDQTFEPPTSIITVTSPPATGILGWITSNLGHNLEEPDWSLPDAGTDTPPVWEWTIPINGFLGSSAPNINLVFNAAIMEPFLPYIRLPIIFAAMMWSVGRVWDEFRRT